MLLGQLPEGVAVPGLRALEQGQCIAALNLIHARFSLPIT